MSDQSEIPSAGGNRRTGWAELESGETVELASIGLRFAARVLDLIIFLCAYFGVAVSFGFLLVLLFEWFSSDSSYFAWILSYPSGAFVSLVGWLVYEVVQVAVSGRTLGKRIVGIRIIDAAHGEVPGGGKSFRRWVIPGLISLVPFFGWIGSILCYVSATWDQVYQGWHDKVAGTLVIKA